MTCRYTLRREPQQEAEKPKDNEYQARLRNYINSVANMLWERRSLYLDRIDLERLGVLFDEGATVKKGYMRIMEGWKDEVQVGKDAQR